MKPHEELLGKKASELKGLAPEATHQNRRGGLYKNMGIAYDGRNKEPFADERGILRAWLHVYPYEQQIILKPVSDDHKYQEIKNLE